MSRDGHTERGIARAYLKQADTEPRPEWVRMWLDLAMTRLLAADGDEDFRQETMALYYTVKERHRLLSIELGYPTPPPPSPPEPGTLRYIIEQRRTAVQQGGV